jgi:hypothetical protein
MVSTNDPKTTFEAKASIQAELDRIAGDFLKSLRKGNAAVEILMMGMDQKSQYTENPKDRVA